MLLSLSLSAYSEDAITWWFLPAWRNKADKARAIALALKEHSGQQIRPRIAKSHPEILTVFSSDQQNLVYVSSFVQAIIKAGEFAKSDLWAKRLLQDDLLPPK